MNNFPEERAYRVPGLNRLEDHEESVDVSAIHASILREKAEPREGHEPISLWMIALTGILLFWGGFYLQRYSGNFKALVYDEMASGLPVISQPGGPSGAPDLAKGKMVYSTICAACHDDEGQGKPSIPAPPLAGSEWVTDPSPTRIIRVILHGLKGPIQVKGETFPGIVPMTPLGEALTNDADIAAVLTYIRNSWGNKASEVKPEQVTAIREKTKTRAEEWTPAELQAIPEGE